MADSSNGRRGPGCLGCFLALFLAASLLLNFILFSALGVAVAGGGARLTGKAPKFEERLYIEGRPRKESGAEPAKAGPKIALIDLRGLIASEIKGQIGESMVEDMEIALRQAAEDPAVKAVLLQIESPGGEVTASDRVYHAIKKTREKKPVVVYLGSVAASGGYYAACGGSWLVANDTTFTGSIGVIISTFNFESLLGKIGVAPVVFKSGRFKDILSGARPMTDEEKALVQGIVTQAYEKFLGIVAAERKLDPAVLREKVADGRILTGSDALAAGLIDSVGQFEDALAKARELGGAPDAPLHRYEAGFRLGGLFRALGESLSSGKVMRVEVGGATGAVQLQPGRLYYLPPLLGGI